MSDVGSFAFQRNNKEELGKVYGRVAFHIDRYVCVGRRFNVAAETASSLSTQIRSSWCALQRREPGQASIVLHNGLTLLGCPLQLCLQILPGPAQPNSA